MRRVVFTAVVWCAAMAAAAVSLVMHLGALAVFGSLGVAAVLTLFLLRALSPYMLSDQ